MKEFKKELNTASKTTTALSKWHDLRLRLFVEGIIVGIFSGSIIVFYRYLLEKAENLRTNIYDLLSSGNLWLICGWFFILILIGLFLGFLIKDPMIRSSGIPQVKGILISQLKMNWLKVLVGKFIGSILAIGAGLSLGTQGPSIQLGAAAGQGISRIMGRQLIEEKYLITSGASAGLAAAFNAPLAGVIFALEEMHKNFSPMVLTSSMAASLTADFLSQQFFGSKPIFSFENIQVFPLNYYHLLIILGLIIGVLGCLFKTVLVLSMDFYKKVPVPENWKPVFPLMVGGLLGFIIPEVLGGGQNLINQLHEEFFTLKSLVFLLIVKFAFTMLSYGSGAPGGIFLPLLVIGALAGNAFSAVALEFSNLEIYADNFIVLAMAAFFTAIVKAPITGSILITEMTGSFSHLLAMITVSMTAYLVTDIFKSGPAYEILLERMLKNEKKNDFIGEGVDKSIIEIPVSLGSALDGKSIKEIKWMPGCLLVAIKRGEKEIIPNGSTKIYSGDYLVILTDEDKEVLARSKLQQLASEKINELK
ncbi:MAG: ClC family H(+)/Cl(-) exchange transporter [Clostridia bacterium]|nr:ClC family H(+)/Cl(-) exchange transporter [Clostridia bacterium]